MSDDIRTDDDKARLDHALAAHTFDLMTSEGIGGVLAGVAFTIAVALVDTGYRYFAWAALQLLALVVCVGVYGRYVEGGLVTTNDMRRARRLGVVATGITWGAGALLWPIGTDLGLGFALMFCYAGLCAGAAATLAGDPIAYVLFATTTLLPEIVLALPELWWVSAMLALYFVVTARAAFANRDVLAESLLLRFEHTALLARTMAEREGANAAREDAERAADAKSRFLAAASHDLRQPVQALALFVDVLRRDPLLDAEQRRRTIEALARTSGAMRSMLEALLDISRFDARLVVPAASPIALAPLLDAIVAEHEDEAAARDVVVHVMGRAATVHADPVLLRRAITNVLTNAIRHGGRGRVLVAIRHRRHGIAIEVWDQGPGIAPAEHDRIFDEYVQLDNRERDRRKGLGLGLAVAKRICTSSGFALSMRSRLGRGSVFTITLPSAASG